MKISKIIEKNIHDKRKELSEESHGAESLKTERNIRLLIKTIENVNSVVDFKNKVSVDELGWGLSQINIKYFDFGAYYVGLSNRAEVQKEMVEVFKDKYYIESEKEILNAGIAGGLLREFRGLVTGKYVKRMMIETDYDSSYLFELMNSYALRLYQVLDEAVGDRIFNK